MSSWLEGRVAARKAWTDKLHSIEVDAPGLAFTAGQFARLALPAPPGAKEPMIGRPYSFVNPPGAPRHACGAPRRSGAASPVVVCRR